MGQKVEAARRKRWKGEKGGRVLEVLRTVQISYHDHNRGGKLALSINYYPLVITARVTVYTLSSLLRWWNICRFFTFWCRLAEGLLQFSHVGFVPFYRKFGALISLNLVDIRPR